MISLKTTIALLYEVYGHIYFMSAIEGRYYDEFLVNLISGEVRTMQEVRSYISNFLNFSLNLDSSFVCVCVRQKEGRPSLFKERKKMFNKALYKLSNKECIYGITDRNTISILFDASIHNNNQDSIKEKMLRLVEEMNALLPGREFKIGIGDSVEQITMAKKSHMEARKAIEIGSYLYSDRSVLSFQDLGPFGVLRFEDVERKSFGNSFSVLTPLLEEENSSELLETLKVYLECNQNFSKAASMLFIHTNTVRYRINKIQEICNFDLDDYVERLKIEITLRFIEMINVTDTQ